MASSSEPSKKQGREEVPPPPPIEPEEVPPPPPDEPEEALAPQPVAVVRARPLNADEATWLVNLFRDAFVKLRKVAIHPGVPTPSDPLQMTVKDHAFKINIMVGDLERGVLASSTTATAMMAASTASAPAPTPTVGLLRQQLPLLN
jgi:hypothetical protein